VLLDFSQRTFKPALRSVYHATAKGFVRGYNADHADGDLWAVKVPTQEILPCYEPRRPGRPCRLVTVFVSDPSWSPKSWQDRPSEAAIEVAEVVRDPLTDDDNPREFCMGFNHQAMQANSRLWALVLASEQEGHNHA
jgi:hypothetical protein